MENRDAVQGFLRLFLGEQFDVLLMPFFPVPRALSDMHYCNNFN